MKLRKPTSVFFCAVLVIAVLAGLPIAFPGQALGQPGRDPSSAGQQNVDWPVVNGSAGNTHYSSLTQINTGNVSQLKIAWTYDITGDAGPLETNPIVINGILYGYTPDQKIFALNAATGQQIWIFDVGATEPKIGQTGNNRGVSYWRSGSDERIFAAVRKYVYSLDAKTGKPDPNFGDGGRIDYNVGLRSGPDGPGGALGHPPAIYKDLLIFSGRTGQTLPADPAPVRAYDVRTGKLRWQFNLIPQPGEYGYQTWPKNAWTYTAGAVSWMGMAVDEKRGILYVPVSNAVNLNDGIDRPGNNLFANSLLALDAATGKRIWHFQMVRHDVWDRDVTSPPALLTVKRNGRNVDAVAVTTKSGFVWLFDRTNGKPLFPISYKKYPASSVPGEKLSRTQPLPTKPAPFARQELTADMLTERTPEAHADALARFSKMVSGGQFTPPMVGVDTVLFPGSEGGGEWGGVAIDPDTDILYVNSNEQVWVRTLEKNAKPGGVVTGKDLYLNNCAACHGAERLGSPPEIPSLVDVGKTLSADQVRITISNGRGRMPAFSTLPAASLDAIISYVRDGVETPVAGAAQKPVPWDTQYRSVGRPRFLDIDGYPAITPPWGTLNAINMNSGAYAWKIPLGEYPELAAKGMTNTGSDNYGGPILTAGGLVFIAATNYDNKMHAFDKKTGKLLWQATLPFPGNATPATYEVGGRQFVVIATSSSRSGNRKGAPGPAMVGARYVAFALPADSAAGNGPAR